MNNLGIVDFTGDNIYTKKYDTCIYVYQKDVEIKFKCHRSKISEIKYFLDMYTKDSVKYKIKNKVITQIRIPYKWDYVIEILLNHLYGIHINYEIFDNETIQNLLKFYMKHMEIGLNTYIVDLLIHTHNKYIHIDREEFTNSAIIKNVNTCLNSISKDQKISIYSKCDKFKYVYSTYYNRYIKRNIYDKIDQQYHSIIFEYLLITDDINYLDFMLYAIESKMNSYSNKCNDISLSELVKLVDYFTNMFKLYYNSVDITKKNKNYT